jgi:zinc protease
VVFPSFHEAVLPNGMTLVVIEHHEQPTVSASLTFRAGTIHDPAGKEGLAEVVAELLTKGTPTRSAEQIAATIEGVGGTLTASADQDFLTIAVDALSSHVELAFELLADVTRRASYPEAELELARTRFISALRIQQSTPEGLADRFFVRELYGRHAYGRRPTADSYAAVTRADVRGFATARLRPRGALLVVAGDVTPERVRELLTKFLSGWTGAPPAPAQQPPLPAATQRRILLVHRPGSVQANIVAGNTTFRPADTGFYAARIATQVLGGGPDSRLFLILRESKGWTYGAYAELERYRGLGHWHVDVAGRTEVADSALSELLKQIDLMRAQVVPDSELGHAKGYLVGSFPLTIETPSQIARQVAEAKRLGLSNDYLRLYRDRLARVTAAQARAAARRVFRSSAMTIVVVGDAAKLHERLAAIGTVRLVDTEGKPLSPAALMAPSGPPRLDRSQLTARSDSFRVVVQGNELGGQVSRLQPGGDSVTYVETMSVGPMGQQQTTIVFNAADFSMRRMDQTGSFGGQQGEAHFRFNGDRIQGNARVPQRSGAPKELAVDTVIPVGTYDDNAVPVILPALSLRAGSSIALNVFSSSEGAVKAYTLKVGNAERVTVPAGTFQALGVEVSGGQSPVVIYVSTQSPRRIVKIAPVGAPIVLELVK